MATQPVEDIDAVLGRFQAWSGARNAVEAKPGIREIPYEEALASERYRWKGMGASAVKKTGMKSASEAAAPERRKAEPDGKQHTAKKVRARGHQPKADSTSEAEAKARSATAAKSGKGPTKGGGKNRCAAKSSRGAKMSAASPAFREVLAEAVKPAEVVAAQPAELARQAAITIRLAAAERSVIQTRAVEAGTTVSAYMRQCALEVEQMREQVRQAMAAMECGAPAAAPVVGRAPEIGFFRRIMRRFFPRRATVLALRA